GANDIASSANKIFTLIYHEKKRFVERVDYLTSPGWLTGGRSREEAGLMGGGVEKVITNLGILGFDNENREMELVAVHPGVDPKDVQERTGFPLRISKNLTETPPPTEAELALLR